MKTLINVKHFILFTILVCSFQIQAQNYYDDGLKVLNPEQGNWTKTAGKFENIQLTITPAGNFTNIDILLEISAQNTSLANSTDSLEAEYKFSLPSGSIIHDAKLWMNNVPVKAEIYERSKAKFIYESLVSRKVDPLILYQNPDNSYEARVYPFINPANRKLSISYLVPNNITSKGIEVPLDLKMFRSDLASNTPTINIKVLNNSSYGVPYFMNNVTTTTVGNYTNVSLLANSLNIYNTNAIYFSLPTSPSFFTTQPINANEGYYQLMVMPTNSSGKISKTTFVVDYSYADYISYPTLMNMLKNKIKFNMNDNDLFNVVFVQNNTIQKLSTTWIACDSASIENAFTNLPVNLSSTSSMFLPAMQSAITFINANGAEGNLLVISNAGNTGSNANFQNQLITSTVATMINNYPIYVFDFNNYFSYSIWTGSEYLHNNEYFFYNVAIATGGNYFSLKNNGSNSWYYNSTSSFIDKFSTAFSSTKWQHTYDALNFNTNSILYSEYKLKNKVILPVGEAYMEVGKYINTPSTFQLNYYYGIDTNNYQENYTLTPTISTDTFTKKIWGSNYIDELMSNNSNSIYNIQIVNNSILFDVLCEYTALLALEPDTAGTITNEIPLETPPGIEKTSIDIKVYPNPFEESQFVECTIPQSMNDKTWSIEVYTSHGQLITKKQGNTSFSGSLKIDWYNKDQLDLTSGMYFIKITIGEYNKVVRVIKK